MKLTVTPTPAMDRRKPTTWPPNTRCRTSAKLATKTMTGIEACTMAALMAVVRVSAAKSMTP